MKFKFFAVSVVLALLNMSFAAEINVSAASSLTNAFKDVAAAYEKQNSQDKVNFNFAASGVLLQQMRKGAPIDIFASADQKNMQNAVEFNLVDKAEVVNFAENKLVLIQPIDSKKPITSLNDFTKSSVKKVAIGNPETVPAGNYSKATLEKLKLWEAVKDKMINTQNVRQCLDYVAQGNVDAGLVYQTDAFLLQDKVAIKAQVETVEPIIYPIAALKDSKNKAAAAKFIAFVKGEQGQAILAKYGFATAN